MLRAIWLSILASALVCIVASRDVMLHRCVTYHCKGSIVAIILYSATRIVRQGDLCVKETNAD